MLMDTLTPPAWHGTLLPTFDKFKEAHNMTVFSVSAPHTSGVTNTGESAPCNHA